jgi:hypothetical protein
MPPPSVALPRAVEARFGTGHWHWMLARRLAQEPAQPRSRCPSGRLRVDVFGTPQPASPSPPGLVRNLPVMQSTRFEFASNLGTARALGIEVPEALVATAEELIK